MRVTVDLGDIKEECFVLMPFAPKFDLIYEEVLRPAIEDAGLEPTRADQIYGNKRIMQDVWNGIRGARMVLAELTGRNANVLYELGLAHSLGKQAVIIANTMDDVPFDLKDVRCIVYDKEHPRWGDFLRSNVTRTMRSVLEGSGNDTLYTGITSDSEYQPISKNAATASKRRPEEAEQALDIPNLAGEWDVEEAWEYPAPAGTRERKARMYLEQDGRSLSGHSQSGFVFTETQATVDQEISGFVRDNRVELVATSYQLLHAAADDSEASWNLDTWHGELIDDETFRGTVSDGIVEGTFVAKKVTPEIQAVGA